MKYSLEIEVEKPLSEVAEIFGNEENLPKWQPGYQGSEVVDGETRLKYLNGGKTIEMVERVKVDNLPREFTASYETPFMTMEVQNLFTEAGEGRTKWISNNDCQMTGFKKLLMWMFSGCAKRMSFSYMKNFKALAEEGQDIRDQKPKR